MAYVVMAFYSYGLGHQLGVPETDVRNVARFTRVVMAYVVTTYLVVAYIVMASIVVAYIVMAYIVMAYIVVASIVTACIVTVTIGFDIAVTIAFNNSAIRGSWDAVGGGLGPSPGFGNIYLMQLEISTDDQAAAQLCCTPARTTKTHRAPHGCSLHRAAHCAHHLYRH